MKNDIERTSGKLTDEYEEKMRVTRRWFPSLRKELEG